MYKGKLISADFEESTMEFEISHEFTVKAGEYVILSKEDHQKLVKESDSLPCVIGRLSFKEIEMLVQLKHYDDWEYGNDEKRCAELVEATRNKIGYTKADVKAYL